MLALAPEATASSSSNHSCNKPLSGEPGWCPGCASLSLSVSLSLSLSLAVSLSLSIFIAKCFACVACAAPGLIPAAPPPPPPLLPFLLLLILLFGIPARIAARHQLHLGLGRGYGWRASDHTRRRIHDNHMRRRIHGWRASGRSPFVIGASAPGPARCNPVQGLGFRV